MESEIKFTISILEFHLPSWGPCFRGTGLSALWVCETRGRVTFLSAPTSTINTHLSHTHGWWPTLGTQTHSLQMSAIAFSFQKIPSAFSIAASPVTSLHDQWPHTFSQFSLPLGTSGESSAVEVTYVWPSRKCLKGAPRDTTHSMQLWTIPFLCLQLEAQHFLSLLIEEENQSIILVLPASQEEPSIYIHIQGYFSGQHGA